MSNSHKFVMCIKCRFTVSVDRLVSLALRSLTSQMHGWKGASLVPRPFEEEEKEPGIHCTRMREVYGGFSSIIRRILSLPRGRTPTDKVY